MEGMNDIVRIAVDAYHGNVNKYSTSDAMEVLRQAMIEANGGSTKIDYKRIRDGKCGELFALVEEILNATVASGLSEDDFFNTMVEYRDVSQGDSKVFLLEDTDLFTVAETAEGTQGVRRQRIGGVTEVPVPTRLRTVKVYDELNRILAGQVDWNNVITRVGESFRQQLLMDIYSVWAAAVAADFGGTTYFPAAGAYNEATLLNLIDHVEAAAGGKPATIIGTKAALRQIAPTIQSQMSKNDLYAMGFYGSYYGTPCVAMPQRHVIGTDTFAFDNNVLTIIAGDQKPIKVVREGNPLIIPGVATDNYDLTQNYLYGDRYGIALVTSGNTGIGRYDMTH